MAKETKKTEVKKEESPKEEKNTSDKLKPTKNTNKIIGIIIGVVVIVGLLIGAYFAVDNKDDDKVDKDEQKEIKSNVSKNYKVYDEINSETLTKIEEIMEIDAAEPTNQDEITQNIQKFEQYSQEIDTLITKFETAKTSLEKGPNSDTEELVELMEESLDANAEVTTLMDSMVDFRICIDGKTLKYYELTDDINEYSSQMETADADSFVNILEDMETTLDKAAKNTDNIKTCFTGNQELFNDKSVEKEINNLKKMFTDLKAAMTLLKEGVQQNDLDKVNQAYEAMMTVSSSTINMDNPEFIENYSSTLAEKIDPLVDNADEAEQAVLDKIEDIADEYDIDEKDLLNK